MTSVGVRHDCKAELNDRDLRATPARIALMGLFEASDKPVDVQGMIDYLEQKNIKTDPATVFRIVNLFTQKGLLKQIQLHEGKQRYELFSKADHHHFVCEDCGKIEDISDCNIEKLEKTIRAKKGLLVKRHSLEFFGLCKNCQK